MHTAVIIVSAGQGRRFGAPKHEARLHDRPVLEWSLQAFHAVPEVGRVVLVLRDPASGEVFARRFSKIATVVEGGAERQDSVWAGFQALPEPGTEVVLVHDAARPLVGRELILRVIHAAADLGAAVPVVPVPDTLKEVAGERILSTPDRRRFFLSQTPQGYRYAILKAALSAAVRSGFRGTDEAQLVEKLGRPVATVPGEAGNIKITTPVDLKIAEACLEA
jgi:2-C-methyl-D-erythritol 4-phosphate cytidylyltransferase